MENKKGCERKRWYFYLEAMYFSFVCLLYMKKKLYISLHKGLTLFTWANKSQQVIRE